MMRCKAYLKNKQACVQSIYLYNRNAKPVMGYEVANAYGPLVAFN